MNHGSVAALALSGAASTGDLKLYTIDEDLSPNGNATLEQGLWQYNIGSGPLSGNNTIPTELNGNYGQIDFVSQTMGLQRGADGKFYITDRRSAGNEGGLFVLGPTGTALYSSLTDANARGIDGDPATAGIQDPFRESWSVAVSPDQKYIAIIRLDSTAWVVPLINGIPDMPNRMIVQIFDPVANGRDVAFDAADNLYAVSSGNAALRVFSPGGVSQTTYNSNGTFTSKVWPEWTGGNGNLSDSSKWLLNSASSGKSAIAMFGNSNTAPATVNIDTPTTLGNVYFDSANSYTLSGSTLTLDSYGEPRVQTFSGSHEISAPLVVNENLQVTTNAGSSLRISGPVSYGTLATSFTKAGDGTLEMTTYRIPTLNVQGGTAKVIAGGGNNGVSNVQNLNIAGTTDAWSAKLDLNDSAIVIDYPVGSTTIATVQNQIKNGFHGGDWTGNGITSSAAAAAASSPHKTALGYADLTSPGTFLGQTVDGSAVGVRYTYAGDANLDGKVDTLDFNALAANFGGSGKVWTQADFNYDGTVDTLDFNNLAANFGQQLADAGGGAGGAGALVPEPTSIALLGLGAAALMTRRRRRQA
jgi:hypothetical protein